MRASAAFRALGPPSLGLLAWSPGSGLRLPPDRLRLPPDRLAATTGGTAGARVWE